MLQAKNIITTWRQMKHGGNDQKLLIQQERTILKFLVQQALVSYLHLLRMDQSSKSVQAVEVGAGGWYKLGATVIIARGGILYLSCTAQYLLSNLFEAGPWLQLLLGRRKDFASSRDSEHTLINMASKSLMVVDLSSQFVCRTLSCWPNWTSSLIYKSLLS